MGPLIRQEQAFLAEFTIIPDIFSPKVTYNAKIITTGVFSVLLLSKKLSLVQWTALVTLMIGVSTIQLSNELSMRVLAANRFSV